MKNLLITLFLLAPFLINAQQTEGKIFYKETIQLKIDLPEEHKHLLGHIPSSQSNPMVLHFNQNESLYKNFNAKAEDDVMEAETQNGDVKIKMVIATPENRYYQNMETQETISQQEFFGKKFLIEDKIEKLAWKITTEQKVILNYPCTKAVYQDSTQTVEAWFSSQIPVSSGPNNFGQLPGMILELNIDNGDRTIVAQDIRFETQDADILKAPKKGKKVTKEAFEKIVTEKTKEMEEEMGGRGTTTIKIRN